MWWLSPALMLVAGFFVWLSHFRSGFHIDDVHQILSNRAISDGAFWRMLTDPRAFSSLREYADYRPLVLLTYFFDYRIAGTDSASFFQLQSFFWFVLLLLAVYLLFVIIPGAEHRTAVLAAALFAFHPIAADTVNYLARRGTILGAIGLVLGMCLWIYWPSRMPARIPFDMNKVPTSWLDQMVWEHGAEVNELYALSKTWSLGLHLYPVFVGMLCEPSVAAFPLLALAYSRLFEPGAKWKRFVAPSILCSAYLALHAIVTWQYSGPFRQPAMTYWSAQPLVIVRGFYHFLFPTAFGLDTSVDGTFSTATLAMAFAGLLVMVAAAILTGRAAEWRGVSFGLWWYLLAFVPRILEPQRTLDTSWSLFIPMIGLALAASRMVWIIWTSLPNFPWPKLGLVVMIGYSFALVAILGGLGWATYKRSVVWTSDVDLWQDAANSNPFSSRASVNAALASQDDLDDTTAVEYFERARLLTASDPVTEYKLAFGLDKLGYDGEAEKHMKRAVAMLPNHSIAFAQYSRWLLNHRRVPEALEYARKAAALGSEDVLSRLVMMEIYAEQYDWSLVRTAADEVLRVEPDQPKAQHYLAIAQYSLAQADRAEGRSKEPANADDLLAASVVYYQHKRYDQCVDAAKKALKLQPNLPEAYANIATAYHSMGKLDESIEATRELLHLRPNLYFAASDLQVLLHEKAVAEGKKPPVAQAASPKKN